jgi:hypothetical protein
MNDSRTLTVEVTENVGTADVTGVPKFPGVIGTFMGRDALSLAVSYLRLTQDDTVLLPAYLCHEVLRPFLGNTKVAFYDIRPDLTIDPDEISGKLKATKTRMLIIINYFGFLQPYRKELKEICADNGTVLMEDCAHSLLTEGSGETGDLSIYSFRKILSVPDGGGLRANIDGEQAAIRFYPKIYSTALSLLIIAKSSLKLRSEKFSRAGIASGTQTLSVSPERERKSRRVLPLSSVTNNGISRASFPEIIRKRRRAFDSWLEVCRRNEAIEPVFGRLTPEVCPMNFPVKVKDRDSLKLRAGSEGIYLQTFWRLPSCVGDEFRNARRLALEVAALPVNPECSNRDREVLTELIA